MMARLFSNQPHGTPGTHGTLLHAAALSSGPVPAVEGQVTVRDLVRTMQHRQDRQQECYAAVLERCYGRIRRCAAANRYECLYEVPDMIVGKPLFDLNRCIRTVMKSLTTNGFAVTYYFPRFLHVSWRHGEDTQPAGGLRSLKDYVAPPVVAADSGHGHPDSAAHPDSVHPFLQPQFRQQSFQTQQQQSLPHHQQQQHPPQAPPLVTFRDSAKPQFRSISEFKPSGRFVL
jgi:hypothetical protein